MARKKVAAPPVPTPARVEAALRSGDFAAAADLARQLHTLTPTPTNVALRKRVLSAAATHYADRDKQADFQRIMAEAVELTPEDGDWITERACLLARGGSTEDALRLADPAAHIRVLGHATDRAIRLRSKEWLPAELHAGFDAILAAFARHEAGNEAAARESLEPIGLRSPFLEWKVLLRGLLAHAAGDHARAAENFARLDPVRLPAKLAAPLRVGVDPAFKAALPADTAVALLKQHEKLTAGPILDGLRTIARELGRDKPLGPAFRAAAAVVPLLKQSVPQLLPRLASCFYHALLQQGEQTDLPRYLDIFGTPPDDPNFQKLVAQIGEQIGDLAMAHSQWQRYESWLAGQPAGWPESLTARARGQIWMRMGENARLAAERPDEPDDLFGLFGPPPRRRKVKPLAPPAEECFRRATQAAPDWPPAASRLFAQLVESKKAADAEAIGREFLTRHPEDLEAMTALADLLTSQGRAADAAGLWLRALAINPLDRVTRKRAAGAVLADARQRLTRGDAADAEAVLERHRTLLTEETPAGFPALRSVILAKLGRTDEVAASRTQALAVPGARLSVAYRLMVDSQLAKLKPAEKRAADRFFADELARPVLPQELSGLLAVYDAYHLDAVTYRGQKTHEKKILDQVARCLTAEAPEVDFEQLADLLVFKRDWKRAKKLTDACIARFPNNPHFLLVRCEAGLAGGERPYHLEQRGRQAKRLAEASSVPRHRALLERIDQLLKQVGSPFDFLNSFFGGGRD